MRKVLKHKSTTSSKHSMGSTRNGALHSHVALHSHLALCATVPSISIIVFITWNTGKHTRKHVKAMVVTYGKAWVATQWQVDCQALHTMCISVHGTRCIGPC